LTGRYAPIPSTQPGASLANEKEEKKRKGGAIPTSVPDSAFEEALRAIENIQKTGSVRSKAKKTEASDDEEENLQSLLSSLGGDDEADQDAKNGPSASDPGGKSDLDLLAALLEEEQNLEKEAEFLKSVLLEAQASQNTTAAGTEEVKKKEGQIQDLQDRLLRIQAEFDNFKKRINRDKADMVRFSNENLILTILPVIDNFERAISHAAATNDLQATIEGVRLIVKQLYDTLQLNGVRKVDATDQMFDPAYHEAMATIATDTVEPGRVLTRYEPGYLLHNRLLRPAKVVVAMKSEAEGGKNDTENLDQPKEASGPLL
jgi:molecular chaperone GrpE